MASESTDWSILSAMSFESDFPTIFSERKDDNKLRDDAKEKTPK